MFILVKVKVFWCFFQIISLSYLTYKLAITIYHLYITLSQKKLQLPYLDNCLVVRVYRKRDNNRDWQQWDIKYVFSLFYMQVKNLMRLIMDNYQKLLSSPVLYTEPTSSAEQNGLSLLTGDWCSVYSISVVTCDLL